MESVNEQLRGLLKSIDTTKSRHEVLDLINTFLIPSSSNFSEVIEQETFHELLGHLVESERPRSRYWSGLYIVKFLQNCDIAHAHLFAAPDNLRIGIGDILTAPQNEDLKLIAGAIIALACSKGEASPIDFFRSGSTTPLIDNFPQIQSSRWIHDFREYLVEHGNHGRVLESDSTVLLAASVVIENIPLSNVNASTLVELSPKLLSFTQLSPSQEATVLEINLDRISRARFQSSGLSRLRSSTSQIGGHPHIVLKLRPDAGNHILNSEERFADEIKFVAEPSYDVKGFVAALLEVIPQEAVNDENNEKSVRNSSTGKAGQKDALVSYSKAAIALASLEMGTRSPEGPSTTERQKIQARQSIRSQLRDEQGESKSSSLTKATKRTRPEQKGKLKSPDKQDTFLDSDSLHLVNRAQEPQPPVDEPFAIPTSPGKGKSSLKGSKSKAPSSRKTPAPKQITGKIVKQTSKIFNSANTQQLQIVTKAADSEGKDFQSGSDAEEIQNQQPEDRDIPERRTQTSKISLPDERKQTKEDNQIHNEPVLGSTRTNPTGDEAYDFPKQIKPHSHEACTSTDLYADEENGFQHSLKELHGRSTNGEPEEVVQPQLADWSIRKPPVALFGRQGPVNQGTVLSKHREHPSEQVLNKPEIPEDTQNPNYSDGVGDMQEDMVLAFPSESADSSPRQHLGNAGEEDFSPQHKCFGESMADAGGEGNSNHAQTAYENVNEMMASPLKSSPQKNFNHCQQQISQLQSKSGSVPRCASKLLNKRPTLEEVSGNSMPKRRKHQDEKLSENYETSLHPHLSEGITVLKTASRRTGTELSRRVDTNGSPYPSHICLPIDKTPSMFSSEVGSTQISSGTSSNKFLLDLKSDSNDLAQGVAFQDSCVLWCENLPSNVRPDEVKDLFENYGSMEWSWIVRRIGVDGVGSCCGYVKMRTADDANFAAWALNDTPPRAGLRVHQVDQALAFGPVADENATPLFRKENPAKSEVQNSPSIHSLDAPEHLSHPGSEGNLIGRGERSAAEASPSSSESLSSEPPPVGQHSPIFKRHISSPLDQQQHSKVKNWIAPDITGGTKISTAQKDISVPSSRSEFTQHLQFFASPVKSDSSDPPSSSVYDCWDDLDETLIEELKDNGLESPHNLSTYDQDRRKLLYEDESSENISRSDSPEVSISVSPVSSYASDASEEFEDSVEVNSDDRELQPHQESYADALIEISQALLCHLMKRETDISGVASSYREGGVQLVEKLEECYNNDAREAKAELETMRKRITDKLGDLCKTI